jgi:hypothetical protein
LGGEGRDAAVAVVVAAAPDRLRAVAAIETERRGRVEGDGLPTVISFANGAPHGAERSLESELPERLSPARDRQPKVGAEVDAVPFVAALDAAVLEQPAPGAVPLAA